MLNEERVKFWMKQFSPRTKKWQRETKKRLKAPMKPEVAEFLGDISEKLEALKRLN